jgi:hypothetical protein
MQRSFLCDGYEGIAVGWAVAARFVPTSPAMLAAFAWGTGHFCVSPQQVPCNACRVATGKEGLAAAGQYTFPGFGHLSVHV